jgi:hypothetical protein
MTTHPYLAPSLKKEYNDTFTLRLGLHGLFEGELYLTSTFTFTENYDRKPSIFKIVHAVFTHKTEILSRAAETYSSNTAANFHQYILVNV